MPPSAPNSLGEIRLERLRRLAELKARKAAKDAQTVQNVAARFPLPGDLAKSIDPTTVVTPALELLDANLFEVAERRCERLSWSMPPQEGKPVEINSMVLMGDGTRRRLAEIDIGDYVVTHLGRARRVTAVHEQGMLPAVTLQTHAGRIVTAALDHPFLTPAGWVEAGRLKAGDTLATLNGVTVSDASATLTVEAARLLGYFIGDGCTVGTQNNSSFNASISCADSIEAKDLARCAEALGFTIFVAHKANNRASNYQFSKGVRPWLKLHGLAGCSSWTKRVPLEIYNQPNNIIAEFVGAYFTCDGTVSRRGGARPDARVEFNSVSRELLSDVQHLLLRLGIATTVRKKTSIINGAPYVSWRLLMRRQDDVAKFRSVVPIYHAKAKVLSDWPLQRTAFDGPYFADPVEGVPTHSMVECRCLTVEEDHTFTVEDLIVHNSQRVSRYFPLWMLLRDPELRIVIASYELGVARRWSRAIRNDIADHPELGLKVREDTAAAHEWQLLGHRGGLYAVGVGGGLTGRPSDCLHPQTLVPTSSGEMTIAEIAKLDQLPLVASWSEAGQCEQFCQVEAVRAIPDKEMLRVSTGHGWSVRCTRDHRIATTRGWIPAGLLVHGDRLRVRADHLWDDVVEIRPIGRDVVYDLQVAENHNFVADGITVSNCMIIDDPVKGRAEADSDAYRENTWEWWTETARTRLAPHAPLVLVMTRWSEDDLAGRLIEQDQSHSWKVVNIPAQCDAEPDPLGRSIGDYLESARGRTPEQWEQIHKDVGERAWNALYQGRPSPAEGGMFKRSWWQYDEIPVCYRKSDGTMHAQGMDVVIQSWDMTFKNTDGTDFVVGQVWGRAGTTAHLLDQVRARLDFPETCKAVQDLSAKWPQASLKLIEDKANGPAVISQLRKQVPGMVPVNPEGNKQARAAAVTPFVEAGNVCLPMPARAPWIGALIEEASAFPTGAHDDQVDALTQALARLMLMPSSTAFLEELVNQR